MTYLQESQGRPATGPPAHARYVTLDDARSGQGRFTDVHRTLREHDPPSPCLLFFPLAGRNASRNAPETPARYTQHVTLDHDAEAVHDLQRTHRGNRTAPGRRASVVA